MRAGASLLGSSHKSILDKHLTSPFRMDSQVHSEGQPSVRATWGHLDSHLHRAEGSSSEEDAGRIASVAGCSVSSFVWDPDLAGGGAGANDRSPAQPVA